MNNQNNVHVALKARGDELARNGDFDQAIRYYLKAIDLDRSYIAAWNNLGYSYAKSGKDEDAERCREKIRQLKARAADTTDTGPPRESPSGLPPIVPENPEREPVSPSGDAGVSADSLLARLGLSSTGKPAQREKSGQEPHHDPVPVETARGETFWEKLKVPSPGASEQREPEQEPPEPGTSGSLWKKLIHRSKDKGEPTDIREPELPDSEPAGSPGAAQSSPQRLGFFSALKTLSRAGSRETTSPGKPVPPDAGPGQDTALDALHMEGGEIFRFQGGRSVCTIQNSGQLVGGFDRVLDQHPELSAGFRGIALYSIGRFREALEDFDRELVQDPGATGIWILRAWVLTRLGRNEEALYSCEQALILDPENFDALRQKGFVLQSLGRDQEALHALDRALSLNPHSAEIWVARGRILHTISRDHEALQSYDRALSIDPRSSDLWLSRARSLSRLGREEEALGSLEQGIAANPDNPSLFICQGRMFHVLGKFGEALTAYDRALTIRPDDSRTWEAMGAVLYELGKFRDEAAAYNRAIAIDPANISLHEKRGDALARSGNFGEAARDFRKVLEARPGDMDLIRRLGTALAAAGMIDEAREVLRPLLVSSPDGKQMMKARGEALLALGRYREALVAFREALALYPDDAEVQQGARNAETALGSVHADSIPTGESPEQGQVTKE